MHSINDGRFEGDLSVPVSRNFRQSVLHYVHATAKRLGTATFALLDIPDRLRMLTCHGSDRRQSQQEQRRARDEILYTQLENGQLPWTMETAFYAAGGGCVLASDFGVAEPLSRRGLRELINLVDRKDLVLIQKAAMQDPSKAS